MTSSHRREWIKLEALKNYVKEVVDNYEQQFELDYQSGIEDYLKLKNMNNGSYRLLDSTQKLPEDLPLHSVSQLLKEQFWEVSFMQLLTLLLNCNLHFSSNSLMRLWSSMMVFSSEYLCSSVRFNNLISFCIRFLEFCRLFSIFATLQTQQELSKRYLV